MKTINPPISLYVNIYVDYEVQGFYCLAFTEKEKATNHADQSSNFVTGLIIPKQVLDKPKDKTEPSILLK